MLLSRWLNAVASRLRGARKRSVARSRHGVSRGTSLSAVGVPGCGASRIEQLEDRHLLSAGDLDPTFGVGGLVTTEFFANPNSSEKANAVAIQDDGKMVVVGSGEVFTRYNSDGGLDSSFGQNGRVLVDFTVKSVALQSDDKIVLAGYRNVGNYDFAVARYDSDGTLDTTFAGDGIVTTAIGSSDDFGNSVVVQSDGKIVVAGQSSNGSNFDFAVVRFNTNGTLDTSFDGDGKLTTSFGSRDDIANSVALQSDGKIVVAGVSDRGSDPNTGEFFNDDFAVARYNSNGTLDTTFDTDGKQTTNFGSPNADIGRSVAIQSDGKIVVAGWSGLSSYHFAVAKYNNNGTLDTTFGTNGILTTSVNTSGDSAGNGMALQSDGKIVVAGHSYNGSNGNYDFAVARYNSNGTLDTTFDSDGEVATAIGTGDDFANGVALSIGGKIAVVGSSRSGTNDDFSVVRYESNGALDTTFDVDGKITTNFKTSEDDDYGLALQADGKIVVAGVTNKGSDNDFAVARYNTDGTLDTAFSGDGKVNTTIFGTSDDIAQSVVIQNDGKIVVAGASDGDFAIVRYNNNGTNDTTFDGDGRVTTDFGGSSDGANSVALQSDGKIVVSGATYSGGYDFAISRYNSNGSLDATFSGDGKATVDFNASGNDSGQSVAIQSDGKIVMGGFTYASGSGFDFAVARFNSDGTLDSTFDGDGKLTTDFGSLYDYGYSVALQSDGKIVVAGFSDNGGMNDIALARYNNNGTLDATFGGDGRVTTDCAGANDLGLSIAIQSDGKIVVAGSSNSDFAVARYNSDGTLDATFNSDGWVTTDFGGASDYGYGVALQSDGQIVVAGVHAFGNSDFAVARYLGNAQTPSSMTATLSSGELAITDVMGANNNFSVTVSGTDLVITDSNQAFASAPSGATLSNSDKTLTIPLTLVASGLTINAGDGNDTVTFASISADFRASLTVNGGGGSDIINVNSNLLLGSAISSGHLNLTAETINLNAASIATDGDTNNNDAGSVTLDGAVTLGTDATIDTGSTASADGDITFTAVVNAAVTGAQGLTLQAGSGDVMLVGVGTTTPLKFLTVGGTNHLRGDIQTSRSASGSGIVDFSGTTVVEASSSIVLADDLSFSSPVSVNSGATLTVVSRDRTLNGLVSLWHADGNANDSVGGNDGSLVNGATANTLGQIGTAFHFDGIDDFVQIPSTVSLQFNSSTPSTLENWVQVQSFAGGSIPVTITKAATYGLLYLSGSHSFRAHVHNATGNYLFRDFAFNLQLNRTYHVAQVWTGSELSVYVDGVSLGSGTPFVGGDAFQDAPVFLGKWDLNPIRNEVFLLNGFIDEAAVYNRALSASELQAIIAGSHHYKQTAGTLTVQGTLTANSVTLQGTGILQGSGTINGDVVNQSIVAPGTSAGIMMVNGNYSQASSGNLDVEISGTTAGTQYDQLDVTGRVSLAGMLNLSLGYTPTIGDAFVILNNDGSDRFSGSFANTPEGGLISVESNVFQISYVGGTGNDLVLTALTGNSPVATTLDFGDAPAGYGSASHFVAGPRLGANVDTEAVAHFSSDGLGDDATGTDDENGITFVSSLVVSTTESKMGNVRVNLQNADATANRLDAWIDFNQDGDWFDPGEQIFSNYSLGTTAGSQTLSFTIPQSDSSNVLTGTTIARFRLSTAGGLAPTGAASDGEVEDYRIALTDGSGDTSVTPTPGGGAVEVTVEGGNLVIRQGGNVLSSTPRSTSLRITAPSGGAVSTQVNLNGITASTLPGGITVEGGSGAGDTIVLTSGSFNSATYTYTGPQSGDIDLDGLLIHFSGLESITNEVTFPNDHFIFTEADDVAQLVASGNAAAPLRLQSSNNTFVRTDFVNGAGVFADIRSMGGSDSLAIGTNVVCDLTFVGGDGLDSVSVTSAQVLPGDFTVVAENAMLSADLTLKTSLVGHSADFDGNLTIGADVTIDTDISITGNSDGAFIVSGSINGAYRLTVLGGDGIKSIANVGDVTPLTGLTIAGSYASQMTLNGDIFVDGNIVLGNSKLLLTGSRIIDSEQGNNGSAGSIQLLGELSATVAGADLTVGASTTATGAGGGLLNLFAAGNSGGFFLNDVTLNTAGGTGGTTGYVDWRNTWLFDNAGADAASLTIVGGGDLYTASGITIDTEQGNDGPGGNVNLGTSKWSAIGSSVDVTIDTSSANGVSGEVSFGGANSTIGSPLRNLTIQATGQTVGQITLAGDITTSGSQMYDGAVTLGTDVTLDTSVATSGSISFASAVNATAIGAQGLTVNAGNRDVLFKGVGTSNRLRFLDVVSIGSVHLGGDVLTDRSAGGSGRVYFPGIGSTQGSVVLNTSVTIDTESGDTSGGEAMFYGASFSADAPGRDLVIDGSPNAGGFGIVLRGIDNSGGAYLNDVTLNPGGSRILDYGDIRLDANGADTGDLLIVNGSLSVSGETRTIDTEQGNDAAGGRVDFGLSTIMGFYPDANHSPDGLIVDTSTTAAGTSAGDVTLNSLDPADGHLFNLTIRATGQDSGHDGTTTFKATGNLLSNGSLSVDAGDIVLPNVTSDLTTSGTGTITLRASRMLDIASGASIHTANSAMTLQASNVNLNGGVDSGTSTTTISPLAAGTPINLGGMQQEVITYTMNGYIEPENGAVNPWGISGDGSALTSTDGAAYALTVIVASSAEDRDTINGGVASFMPLSASLTINGQSMPIVAVTNGSNGGGLEFYDNQFSGAFDALQFRGEATLSGSTQRLVFNQRIPASSFALIPTPGRDLPSPIQPTTTVQTGGASTGSSYQTIAVSGSAVQGQLQQQIVETGFTLTDAELDRVTAGILKVGTANAGAITILDSINPQAVETLHLVTGSTVNANVGKTLTISNLAIEAGGLINLSNGNHDADTVALVTASDFIIWRDADGFTVGDVDGLSGVRTNNLGSVTLFAMTGDVTIANSAATNDVQSFNGSTAIRLDGRGATLAIASGAHLENGGTQLGFELSADRMAINGTVNAGPSAAWLHSSSTGRASDLGGADTSTVLGLTDAELDQITAGTLQIGNSTASQISVSAAITRTEKTAFELMSGSAINFTGGSLATAGGNVTLDPGTSVSPASSGVDITAGMGTLAFGSNDDLAIAINGTTVDSQYDQLKVTGVVNLTGVDLVLSGTHMPTSGQSFTIINNDGSDAIIGTFNGLPEGTTVTFNGIPLAIHYQRGDGNDVVLSTLPSTRTWDGGGGADNHWTTAANWSGDVVPSAGDFLVFNGVATTTRNDFPTDTEFGGITLSSTGPAYWTLQGNRVVLGGPDAIVNQTIPFNGGNYYSNQIQLPLLLSSDATFHGAAGMPSTFSIDGAIATQGHTLTLGSSANAGMYDLNFVSGAISGTGAVSTAAHGNAYLTGANTYSGPTTVNNGLRVGAGLGGSITGSPVTVNSGGTIYGSGSVTSPITIGSSGGITGGNVGQFSVGALTLAAGAIFDVSAFSPLPNQFDQIRSTGPINLGGSTLTVSLVSIPSTGSEFKIIDNLGSDPVHGMFAGLPNGATLTLGSSNFVIDYQGGDGNDVVLTVFDGVDFGDAPIDVQSGFAASYPTTLANNGARHSAVGPRLGTRRDGETDAAPNSAARGDDIVGLDDEDGVILLSPLQPGVTGTLRVDVQNAVASSKLDAWIDFNRDGDWSDVGEQIFVSQSVNAGLNTVTFTVPSDAAVGNTFARFRLSSVGGLGFSGLANDGEVEDYLLPISARPIVQLVSAADVTLASDTVDAEQFSQTMGGLSADGRYVAFSTSAANVIAGIVDANASPDHISHGGSDDVFLLDRLTGVVTLVSHAADSFTTTGNFGVTNLAPLVSADGSYVVFSGPASNYVTGQQDSNQTNDVFQWERATGVIRLVSHIAGSVTTAGSGSSAHAAMSSDGSTVMFTSDSGNLMTGQIDPTSTSDLFLFDRVTGSNTLISHAAGSAVTAIGSISGGYPTDAAMSSDGAFVAYQSSANNVVSGQVDNNASQPFLTGDIFLFDRSTGMSTLVSHEFGIATATGNSFATEAGISGDGRFVSYRSRATDLIDAGIDTNGSDDVFLFDRNTGLTTLVTHAVSSSQSANGFSFGPKISEDGNKIAFTSRASNLQSGLSGTGGNSLFVFDRASGNINLISHTPGSLTNAVSGQNLALSADGQWILFNSESTSLVSGQSDSNGSIDAFLYSTQTGEVTLVSHALDSATTTGNRPTFASGFSSNGNIVLLPTEATDLTTDRDGNSSSDLFVFDRATGSVELATRRDAMQPICEAAGASMVAFNLGDYGPQTSMSLDGRYVAFVSGSSSLVSGDTNGIADVFRMDRQTGLIELASVNVTGTGSGNGKSLRPSISADGSRVAFLSDAKDLTADTATGIANVFVRDFNSKTTQLASGGLDGNVAHPESMTRTYPLLSSDGKLVVFVSGVAYTAAPIYQRNLESNALTLVSIDAQQGEMVLGLDSYSMSADGNRVAFTAGGQAYVREIAANTTTLVSVNQAGTGPGNGRVGQSKISADGSHVLFSSAATDLTADIIPELFENYFVRDLAHHKTTLVTVNRNGEAVGIGIAYAGGIGAAISADGTRVAFTSFDSQMTNIADSANTLDVFVRDIVTGNTTLVSVSTDGTHTGVSPFTSNPSSQSPSISADGTRVVFTSAATNLTSDKHVGYFRDNAFVRDLVSGSTTLLSRSLNGEPSGFIYGGYPGQMISPNGRVALFEADVDSLVTNDRNNVADLFTVDLPPLAMYDFGDAPLASQSGLASDYPVTLTEDGARHLTFGPRLGAARDFETAPTHSANADSDDATGAMDDEDGITFAASVVRSSTVNTQSSIVVNLQNADASSNKLSGWIDFNRDGDWNDAGERVFNNVSLGTTDEDITLSFTIPAGVIVGETFARFRLSTAGTSLPTGQAQDGEVEDYKLTLTAATAPTTVHVPVASTAPIITQVIGTDIVVTQGGVILLQTPLDGAGPITVQGNAQVDDVFIVDYSNGDPIPAGGFHFNGGIGGNDILRITGKGQDAVYTPDDLTQGDGVITIDGTAITFTNLEPVDLFGFATVTLNLPNDDDVLTVSDDVDFTFGGVNPAIRIAGTSGGVAIETVAIWNTTTVIIETTINTDGDDSITITGANATAAGITNLTIHTGIGNDTLAITGNVMLSGDLSITTPATITQAGTSTLTVTGTTMIDVGTANVTLDTVTNDFGIVVAIGNNVGLYDDNSGLILGATSVSGSLTVDSDDTITQIAAITGTGSLTKNGAGTLILDQTNTYTGVTTINAGTLLVNSPGSTASGSSVLVKNGTTLGGTGSAKGSVSVNSGATIDPGLPTGTTTGVLGTGNLTLVVGATFNAEVDGNLAGTNYDQLNVTGTVNLGGATLNTSGTVPSASGQVIVLVNNDGVDPVVGTFAGLAEGDTVFINTHGFKLSYVGGTGNDVTLTQLIQVTLVVSPLSINEDAPDLFVFTFTRDGILDVMTVNYAITGTASFITDYTQQLASTFTGSIGTVTFGFGQTTALVFIDPEQDQIVEPNETVTFTLMPGSNYVPALPNTATVTILDDDTDVSLTVSPGAVAENGVVSLDYTFTRSSTVTSPLTMSFAVNGTATFGSDYTQSGAGSFGGGVGSVTFAAGMTTAVVSITPIADSTIEPDETVKLSLTTGPGYLFVAPSSATGTITNDDFVVLPAVTVSVSPSSVLEDGAANLVYTFTRTLTTDPLTVNFSVGGGALFATDYTQSGASSFNGFSGTITFGFGQSTATITVDPQSDSMVEADEAVTLTVLANPNYTGAGNTATGTIVNDDSSVAISLAPASVAENGGTNLVYTFTRTGATTNALTVNFNVGGTATFANDYTQAGASLFTASNGNVTIGAGMSTATVTLTPINDSLVEADETAILTITGGSYTIDPVSSVTGTITNDDVVVLPSVTVAVSPASVFEDGAANLVYTFTRTSTSGDPLTVNFTVGGAAMFTTDYTQSGAGTFTGSTGKVTFGFGQLTATVIVNPKADGSIEPEEDVILTVVAGTGYTVGGSAIATGLIVNDDGVAPVVNVSAIPASVQEDGTGKITYTFTRTGVLSLPLTVDFSVGGLATFITDYKQSGASTFNASAGKVTFGFGQATALVTIDPQSDSLVEGDEDVILTVLPSANYTVGISNVATSTITDNDAAVTLAVSPSSVLEDGGTNLVYTFTRTGATANALTVKFNVGGTATFGTDYTQSGAGLFNASHGNVTFGAGLSTATVTLDPMADGVVEADETAILTITSSNTYTINSPSTATGTISNDDVHVDPDVLLFIANFLAEF